MPPAPGRYEFCRIYVRDLDERKVASMLPEAVDGVQVEARRSEDWTRSMDPAEFIDWPTNVEVHQDDGSDDRGIVLSVQRILDVLREAAIDAVASADFEDELL